MLLGQRIGLMKMLAATCALLRILLAAVEAMPTMLLREIASMAEPNDWPTVVVFKYFAERAVETSEEKPPPFSLRTLRRERVGKTDLRPLVDADEIAADPGRSLLLPTADAVAQAFTAEGVVGSLYEEYEQRGEQVAMAEAVRNAFARSRNLMVEAGTGVGKSMAYLLPAAIIARDNGINVGVATKTNALLDQLVLS